MITKEMIEERKAQVTKERDQWLANLNLANGIIIDCDHWLAQLEADAPAA